MRRYSSSTATMRRCGCGSPAASSTPARRRRRRNNVRRDRPAALVLISRERFRTHPEEHCGRRLAIAMRLEGWRHAPDSPPSFETVACKRMRPPQRLSWLSSVPPFFVVSEHGVERGEKFASNCDEGEHFGFAGGEQTSVEGVEERVVASGRDSRQLRCTTRGTYCAGTHAL